MPARCSVFSVPTAPARLRCSRPSWGWCRRLGVPSWRTARQFINGRVKAWHGCFGYVPQAQLGFFPFTIREVVLMGRTARIGLFGTPSARDGEIADELLRLLNIDNLADRPYTDVSGGERQLALIARALAQEPQVLVMDEPTASLDFGNQVRVLSEIKTLAKRGIAVILSTHDPDQAFVCAQRVAILHRGRLAYAGPPEDVITAAVLRAVYGVEVEIVEVESAVGEKHLICLPSFAQSRPA